MNCPFCGAPQPDGSKFCSSCGSPLAGAQPQQPQYGAAQDSFGQPQQFGQQDNAYGQPGFGQQDNAYGQPSFGQQDNSYGQPSFGQQDSSFGQPQQFGQQDSSFGQPQQFGQQDNAFGQPSFGQQDNAFGQPQSFGQPQQFGTQDNAFGQPSFGQQDNAFGQPQSFGQPDNTFGQPQQFGQQDNAFGQSQQFGQQGTYGQPKHGQVNPYASTGKKGGGGKKGGIGKIVAIIAVIAVLGIGGFIAARNITGGGSGGSGSGGSGSGTVEPAGDYIDENDNVTCLALMDLDGEELADVFAEAGYEWSDRNTMYLRSSDMAAVWALDEDDNQLGEDDMLDLDAGCAGESTVYVNSVAGYSSCKAALRGAAGGEIVSYQDNGEIVIAVLEDSSGNLFFVTVRSNGDDGTYNIVIWNEDCFESGEFEENNNVSGDSVAEAWEEITGESI